MAQIGIKLADGTYFPILDDDAPRRKRLVLSVAGENQAGAQIDIIRRDGEREQYVGCLVLEDLDAETGMDLEFVIGVDGTGNLEARVADGAGAQHQSLSVSLHQLDEEVHFSLPEDIDAEPLGIGGIDSLEDLDTGLSEIEMPDPNDISFDDLHGDEPQGDDLQSDDVFDAGYEDAGYEDDYDGIEPDDDRYDATTAPRPFNPILLTAILLVVLSLLALGAYGVMRLLGARMLPELRSAGGTLLAVSFPRLVSTRGSSAR